MPGRGGRPRAAPLARSARDPAKGRSRPAAWPGSARPPARPPAQRHQPRERAGRRLRRLHSSGAPRSARRAVPRRASPARPQRGGGAGDGCCPRARAPGTPAGGVHTHLAGCGGAWSGRAAEPGPRAAAGRAPGERQAGRRGDRHWAASRLRAPPCPQRRRVPSRRPDCGSGAVAKLSACVDPPRISAWCCALPQDYLILTLAQRLLRAELTTVSAFSVFLKPDMT